MRASRCLHFVFLLIGATALGAQSGTSAESLSIGPLTMSLRLPAGWTRTDDLSEVRTLLIRESVQQELQFALESADGALILGTYGEYTRLALDARDVSDTPAPRSMTTTWGLEPERITNEVIELASGIEVAKMTASGLGSGRDFLTARDTPTVAVWIYVPTIYRQEGRFKSGMLVLQYRSPKAVANGGGLKAFFDLVDTIEPRAGYPRGTIAEFLGQGAVGAPAPVPPATPAPPAEVADSAPPELQEAAVEPDRDLDPESLDRWLEAALGESSGQDESAAQRLASVFFANPTLALILERQRVREFLQDDPEGDRRRALRRMHVELLERQRRMEGRAGVKRYRAYLDAVWPDHGIRR